MSDPRMGIGGNRPPITPPADTDFLADLQARYPEVNTELAGFEAALATYPKDIVDEEVAASLQDLLGKMAKQRDVWATWRKSEVGPWKSIANIAHNFFTTPEEKVGSVKKGTGWLGKWRPRHQAYMDAKAKRERDKAEEEAARQRKEAERLQAEAEAARQRQEAAEAAQREAERKEELARQEALAAEQRRRDADAAAAKALAEEKRIAEEKRQREKAEREQNATNLREAKRLMKQAENLHALAESEEANADEIVGLDAMIKPGGEIGNVASELTHSMLLSEDERLALGQLRTRLGELRAAFNARVDAKERKRREKERKLAEEQAAKETAARAEQRAADEAKTEAVRQERIAAEAAAAQAKEAEKAAKGDVRAARTEGRDAIAEQKAAGRDEKALSTDAARTANRADRLERKVENSSDADFGRVRGDLGTVGSNTGRYVQVITDEAALRAVCGPLGEHFTEDALSGAAYRWMAAHRQSFTKEREEGLLPGVVFIWERGTTIRT